ncbi:S-adenosyl-L-methionine-dependent methyltransferase [Baffinella frigidus]|nr:S-adenosyl-L-methionine-dependent methyltransferase [Cryptophyta sp. CCMP2293]
MGALSMQLRESGMVWAARGAFVAVSMIAMFYSAFAHAASYVALLLGFLGVDQTFRFKNMEIKDKYWFTSRLYDICDWPFEMLKYRKWRPAFTAGLEGDVLDLGCGTGRNLPYYGPGARVTGLDLSPDMLREARARVADVWGRGQGTAVIKTLIEGDASDMKEIASASQDHVLATFLFCVMPNALKPRALSEIARVLRPGGVRLVQRFIAPFFEAMYGAHFDPLDVNVKGLRVTARRALDPPTSRFALLSDTYILIEGIKDA